jgi:outer membrane protein
MIVMKQISTILNVVLLAAVGYLYYYNFSAKKSPAAAADKKVTGEKSSSTAGIPHGNIAYIEIDSLHENYLYYKGLKDELERRQKAGTQALEEKQKRFQARAGQLQQRAQSMTQQEQEAASKEMDNMQQELARGKQDLDNQLFELSNNMKTNVLKNVQNFLMEFNKDKKYDYILSYEPGFMFYKDSTLNITSNVINGLNEMDKKKKQ